jgi:hypothetical protein
MEACGQDGGDKNTYRNFVGQHFRKVNLEDQERDRITLRKTLGGQVVRMVTSIHGNNSFL